MLLAVALFSATVLKAADDWKLYYQNESIAIYYIYTDCHDQANGLHQQKVLYRIVNKSNAKLEVSFNKELLYTNSKLITPDVISKVIVNKGEQVEGDCSTRNTALYTFVKHLDIPGRQLQKCELKNITVKPIE